MDNKHCDLDRFVIALLLVIAISQFNLQLGLQEVMAENGSSSTHINILSDNSSSKSADKTINIKIPSDSNQTYLTIITIIVAAISAGAAWTTYHYAKNAYHFNALMKVFDILNDNTHRNARIRLYRVNGVRNEDMRRAYLKELGVKDESLKTIIPESQNIVLADLDQIGTLVKNGLVPEKEFLEVYWFLLYISNQMDIG